MEFATPPNPPDTPPVRSPAPPASPAPPTARRDSRQRRAATLAGLTLLALLVWPAEAVLLLRFIDPPCTMVMLYQSAGRFLDGGSPGWHHANLPRNRVSRYLYQAIVAAEDQRFFDHHGFDFVEIGKAREKHERRPKRPLRGASTLTQQTAKNLFLPPWRSFIRKGVEAYFTLLMELLWPKERILEMYANIVEFAPGVYGAQAAARYHFHKDASRLTPQEAALLAAVLPNPKRWSASRPTPYIRQRAAWILGQMAPLPGE
jgi:monofunctional biosynthetic peptidoglycan transglycosylase